MSCPGVKLRKYFKTGGTYSLVVLNVADKSSEMQLDSAH